MTRMKRARRASLGLALLVVVLSAWDVHGRRAECKASVDVDCPVIVRNCGSDGEKCYHGSSCVNNGSGIENDLFCDCTQADFIDQHLYAGRYCEYETTTQCDPDHNGVNFCVNGGTCGVNENGIVTCKCPDGFHGPRCEYMDVTTDKETAYQECKLTCANGGQCRKGAKETISTTLTDVADDIEDHLKAQYNEHGEHCACKEGFSGIACELEADICGDGEHVCLHGSKCSKTISGRWTCDCEQAFTEDRKVAGKFCQHHHTSVCTPESQPMIYTGPSSFAFCVNDGVCKDIVEDGESHPGCDCPEAYTGEHCELLKGDEHIAVIDPEAASRIGGGDDTSAFTYVILVFSVLTLLVSSACLLRLNAREKRRRRIIQRSRIEPKLAPPPSTPVTTASGKEVEEDFDEIELL